MPPRWGPRRGWGSFLRPVSHILKQHRRRLLACVFFGSRSRCDGIRARWGALWENRGVYPFMFIRLRPHLPSISGRRRTKPSNGSGRGWREAGEPPNTLTNIASPHRAGLRISLHHQAAIWAVKGHDPPLLTARPKQHPKTTGSSTRTTASLVAFPTPPIRMPLEPL